ncbi:hypothetical protein BVX98_00025, partial [bacterium F11]
MKSWFGSVVFPIVEHEEGRAPIHWREQRWITGVSETGMEGKDQPYVVVPSQSASSRSSNAAIDAYLTIASSDGYLSKKEVETARKWIKNNILTFGNRTEMEDGTVASGLDISNQKLARYEGQVYFSEATAELGILSNEVYYDEGVQFAKRSLRGFLNQKTGLINDMAGIDPQKAPYGIMTGDGWINYVNRKDGEFAWSAPGHWAAYQLMEDQRILHPTPTRTPTPAAENERTNLLEEQGGEDTLGPSELWPAPVEHNQIIPPIHNTNIDYSRVDYTPRKTISPFYALLAFGPALLAMMVMRIFSLIKKDKKGDKEEKDKKAKVLKGALFQFFMFLLDFLAFASLILINVERQSQYIGIAAIVVLAITAWSRLDPNYQITVGTVHKISDQAPAILRIQRRNLIREIIGLILVVVILPRSDYTFIALMAIMAVRAWTHLDESRKIPFLPTRLRDMVTLALMIVPIVTIITLVGANASGLSLCAVWLYPTFQVFNTYRWAGRFWIYSNMVLKSRRWEIFDRELVSAHWDRWKKRVVGTFQIQRSNGDSGVWGEATPSQFETIYTKGSPNDKDQGYTLGPGEGYIGTAETQFLSGIQMIHLLTLEYFRRQQIHGQLREDWTQYEPNGQYTPQGPHIEFEDWELERDSLHRVLAAEMAPTLTHPNYNNPNLDPEVLMMLDTWARRVGEVFRRQLNSTPPEVDSHIYARNIMFYSHYAEKIRRVLADSDANEPLSHDQVTEIDRILSDLGVHEPLEMDEKEFVHHIKSFAKRHNLESIFQYWFEWAHWFPRLILLVVPFSFFYTKDGQSPIQLFFNQLEMLDPSFVFQGKWLVLIGLIALVLSAIIYTVDEPHLARDNWSEGRVLARDILI